MRSLVVSFQICIFVVDMPGFFFQFCLLRLVAKQGLLCFSNLFCLVHQIIIHRDVFSTRVFMQVNRKFDFVCAILASSAPRFYPLVVSGSVCQFVPLAALHPVVLWLFREPLYWDILLAGSSHPFSLAGCVVWPTAFV